MIELTHISKHFRSGVEHVRALHDVSLTLNDAQLTAIIGPSGCGKTTLLNIAGQLIQPTHGTVTIDGEPIAHRNERAAASYRNKTFGYVVQDFALVETDTVFDNARIPLVYARPRRQGHRRLVLDALDQFGVADLIDLPVKGLSGGQRQRVALARAVVNNPRVILADEPTGALDTDNSARVLGHLRSLADDGRTVAIVTHDLDLAAQCDRIYALRDGALATAPEPATRH